MAVVGSRSLLSFGATCPWSGRFACRIAHWAQMILSFSVAPDSALEPLFGGVSSYITGRNGLISNLLMGLVSSASPSHLCWLTPSPHPWAGDAEGDTLVPANHPLPPVSCSRLWTLEGQTSILHPCGDGGTPSAQICAFIPHSRHNFQDKLKKPGDTRRPPLSVFWHDRIIHLRKLQLGTAGGKKTDGTFCAFLLLECIVLCSLAISRWLPVLFQWPCLVFLVHRADSQDLDLDPAKLHFWWK